MSDSKSKTRSCPICDSTSASEFLVKQDLRLVQCNNCSMIYANPVPIEFESGEFYSDSASYYLSTEKLESDYASVRFKRELKIFQKHCTTGSILDVGCSTGAFLHQLKTHFPQSYSVLGTDVSKGSLSFAQSKGVSIIEGNFLTHDFQTSFDAITFWAVIEHLPEPKRFVQKAADLLKPNGFCFILVPNMHSLAVRILQGRYRYILPEHVNYFSPRTLVQLVEDKFNVVELCSTHFNPIVILQDFRRVKASQNDRAQLLKKTTAYKSNPLLRPLQWLYAVAEKSLGVVKLADNLVIVLRKK